MSTRTEMKAVTLDFNDILLNTYGINNCRKSVTDIEELKSSILDKGLLNMPIVWRPNPDTNSYVLIAGYRRHAAIKRIREEDPELFSVIKCYVFDGSLNEALALNIEENIQRVNLNPADEAEAVESLYKKFDDQAKIAEMLHVSTAWVSMRVTLVRRTVPEVLKALREEKISFMQARALANAFYNTDKKELDKEGQLKALEKLLDKSKEKTKKDKTSRSERELIKLEKLLQDTNTELTLDKSHRLSVLQTLKWFRCQLADEDMLFSKNESSDVAEVAKTSEEERSLLDDIEYDTILGNLTEMK